MNGTAIHMQLFAHENVINTKKSDMAVNTLLSLSEPHYPVHNNPSWQIITNGTGLAHANTQLLQTGLLN